MKSGSMWCYVAVLMSLLSCRASGDSEHRVWLSDLDCQWVQQQWSKPQKDRSVEGKPLRIDGRVYTHGLGLHANAGFTVDVRGCRRFEGLVGVDDEVSSHPSSAGCTIRGDGRVLWKSELLKADQKPQAFAIDLAGIDYIEVLIDDAGDGNNSDHIDIVDAFFLTDGTPPAIVAPLPPPSRWQLGDNRDIRWRVSEDTRLPHHDFVEMSGQQVSLVLYYDIDANRHLTLKRKLVWPMLRTIPNDTHASLIHDFGNALSFAIQDGSGGLLQETIEECCFNGVFQTLGKTKSGLEIRRTLFPSMTEGMAVEQVVIKNTTDKAVTLSIQAPSYEHRTDPQTGVYGQYILDVTAQYEPKVTLEPGQDYTLALGFQGRKADDKPSPLNAERELKDRLALIATVQQNLVFECPDEIINRTFELAKIRAADSVFQTRGGLMFAPGGERYYAAIWANDNAEYQGPFAPFQGEASANEAALNAYRHFARFMNDDYKPIPSSIIAEGTDIWNGAGDRGDAAMIAYGASRYALALGDKQTARELWPLITWCLEYCKRKTTPEGVIASDCDELEHRFPAGKANLCTASLNYDALQSAAMLGAALGVDSTQLQGYAARARALRASIAAYFSATVEGYETWQYYQGNDKLRSWICVPFVMGMDERKDGTIEALFSPQLWTPDGLATQSGDKTFWDRSTLYALRGVFCAGRTDLALEKMHAYSKRRLLGEHVPYPVEAYPEGGQRHLAAESALYCRIVTEGLFGIRPAGLDQFECSPRLPAGWGQMSLRHIRAFGGDFDITAQKIPNKMTKITVSSHNKIVTEQLWDGQAAVRINLKEDAASPEIALPPSRWQPGQNRDICWLVSEDTRLPHHDFVEMSGQKVSLILYYDIDTNRQLTLNRRVIWPMLRTIPNDTHASLTHDFVSALSFVIQADSESVLPETIDECRFDGVFHSRGKTKAGLEIRRTLFPSMTEFMAVEQFNIKNTTDKTVTLSIQAPKYEHQTDPEKGVYGQYILDVTAQYEPKVTLEPGKDYTMALGFRGRKGSDTPCPLNVGQELKTRQDFIATIQQNLVFECPDEIITRTFELAKIRAADSVFQTRGGLMFAPGGERYYAAIWANDNGEYQGPFAPFQGEASANEAALNAYRLYTRFMNDEYKTLPSSIIAEGTDVWTGAGDEGDAAMLAYGTPRFLMALGDKQIARQLWPLVAWCLEYCNRKTTPDGVIASDCDELENRFPSGKANLNTASQTYDGLCSAVMLGRELGIDPQLIEAYEQRAKALRESIHAYFSATVEGFETWQYFKGNDKLRSWICIPLAMGIEERREGTIEALFSPQMWMADGLATQSGDKTFWDRSTLYALRGVLYAGRTDLGLEKLYAYSKRRLLGEHVPYPVEAYPEGNQRHLAGESALYCRIVTEGLFGIRPAGLDKFECTPRLPAGWTQMSLRHIRAFDGDFDIVAQKTPDKKIKITVSSHNKIVTEQLWDGQKPVLVHLKD